MYVALRRVFACSKCSMSASFYFSFLLSSRSEIEDLFVYFNISYFNVKHFLVPEVCEIVAVT